MSTEIIMPQMGESIAEGTVVKWLKKPGDAVERDEDLFEISTDKVESVIPAPVSGFLSEILVGEGEKVAVGTVLGTIVASASDVAGTTASKGAAKPVAESLPPGGATIVAAKPISKSEMKSRPSADADAAELRRTRSTPLVRRIASEHDVDISNISGTGLSGRVTKNDIMAYLKDRPASAASGGQALQIDAPDVAVGDGDRLEPLSVMRQNIAQHMVMSRRVSAHCQTVHECDVTHVETLRRKYRDDYAERGGKLSFTVFLVKAVADALRQVPLMNASLSGTNVVYRRDVNVGVAVALEAGLIVPVVKNADEYNLLGLSKAVADVSERARTKKLNPGDVQDGTFTISNAGVFGSLFGIPIINQPQVGILGVGGIKRRVMVNDDDSFGIRSMVHFCLTFDHRLIDGSVADRFMNAIKQGLEEFPENAV